MYMLNNGNNNRRLTVVVLLLVIKAIVALISVQEKYCAMVTRDTFNKNKMNSQLLAISCIYFENMRKIGVRYC